MDWQIESTSVVILGAGFSAAATDGRLPLMTGYFDRLKPHEFPELFEFVTRVGCNKTCERIEFANVERVLVALDQIRTSPDYLLADWLDSSKAKLPLIQQQMAHYTLQRLRNALDVAPDNWAANFLASCGLTTTVISMNYDNIAEQILSNRPGLRHGDIFPDCPHCKMRLLLRRACSCGFREQIRDDSWRGTLIKPHGSIAWRRCLNSNCCSYECLVADELCRPFEPCDCQNCGNQCAPVLVMPTMSKNLNDIPEISAMWQAAKRALTDAESLLLFGFSMPISDELLLQLIRSACTVGKRLRRVAAIDLDPEQVLHRFESCLPPGCDVETVAFPVQKGEVPIWLELNDCGASLRSN